MVKLFQDYLTKYNNYQSEKVRRFTGTVFFSELKTNPIPGWIFILIVLSLLVYVTNYIFYISKFLEYFVNLLEIPKVLKLPILENRNIYRIPAAGFYSYIAFALVWDLANRINSIWSKTIYFTEKGVFVKTQEFVSNEIQKLPYPCQEFSWQWKRGLLRDLLGMNQLVLQFPNKKITSGYFNPNKNKKILQAYLIQE